MATMTKRQLACRVADRLIHEALRCRILDQEEAQGYFDVLVDGLLQQDEKYLNKLLSRGLDAVYISEKEEFQCV